jgi:NAD-dependent dihydropyrimidine dehydrogenase PreA subunit
MGRYRQITVDGTPTGLQGLDEAFARLYEDGRRPGDAELGQVLVEALGKANYIPRSAQDAFAKALSREYVRYVARRERGASEDAPDYGMWRGHPREAIPWFPTINEDLCDGCGRCLDLCSKNCLAPTDDGKVWVADPFRCIVGCSSCAELCKPGAVTFPPRSVLEAWK